MNLTLKKIELLSPAGDLNRLKLAFLYGADACYIGGEHFSLREACANFTQSEMEEGIQFAHNLGKKVYVACNIFPRNEDCEKISQYAKELEKLGPDGVIVADMGVFSIFREHGIPIHISTQANVLNYKSAEAYASLGASRIVLARELSLEQIAQIRAKLTEKCSLEAFVHGAMCISYSGRCLLSNYMTGRDANKGECAQPCRWKYALVEEKRPMEYFPIMEENGQAFILNSKDLCMINHVKELYQSGVTSFKIEGRVKSDYYVAAVTKAYRDAIDAFENNEPVQKEHYEEVLKVSHRAYSTGFYFQNQSDQIYENSSYIRTNDIVGIVMESDGKTVTISQRNKFSINDNIEFLPPVGKYFPYSVKEMENEHGEKITSCPHPEMIVKMPLDKQIPKFTIVRKSNI